MPLTIDAHHHFWRTAAQEQPWRNSSHSALERDFEAEELKSELDTAGVDATILMQSVDEAAENDRLSAYAQNAFVAGVVAWLPLSDADSARRELERINPYKVCGVRTLTANDPLEWLSHEAVIAIFKEMAARGLVWDVVPVTSAQVRAVLGLASAVPDLRIVVDHLGRPPLDTQGWQPWAGQTQQLASCPNIAMKVSVGIDVLSKLDSWSGKDLIPYVEWAGEHFGPSRLMLASNWPVILLKTTYQQAWDDLLAAVGAVFTSGPEIDRVKGGTAEEWYSLGR